MSYLFEPEIPQFPRLTQHGDNFESWRQNVLAVLELIDLGDFVAAGMKGTAREDALARREVRSHLTPALITYAIDFPTTRDLWTALATRFAPGAPIAQPDDLPWHKATKDMKEGGDGQGDGDGQEKGDGKGRGRRRGQKPAVRSQDATGTTNDRPGGRVEAYAHDAKTPSTQMTPADAKGDRHEPMAIEAMAQDETERDEGNTRMCTTPTTPNVLSASPVDPAVHPDVFDASTTPNSAHTNPDSTPTHPDASDAFPSHRIAKLRNPEPTTLDNARPYPFRVGEGDIRRKSTSRDGAFGEGETAYQGVEPNRSQQPVDEDVASIGRNGDKATKLDVPSRLEPPACSAEAGEASEAFKRRNNASSPPIRAPEAPEPSQAWQTMPNHPNRPPPTGHAPERVDDPFGGVHHADDMPTPLLTTHDARSAPQSAPEWVNTTPSMRTRAPTVFNDGGEVCLRHKVIEDSGVPVDGGIVSSAKNDGEDEITNAPSRPTSPAHSPDATQPPEPLETYPASPEPMGDTLEHTGSVRHADDAPVEAAETHEARRTLHNANGHVRGRITPTLPNPARTDLHDAPAETTTTHKARPTDRDEVGNARARNAPIASNSVHTSPSDTPGHRIAPSTHPKGANSASERTRHARIHAYDHLQMPCVRASVFDFILLFFIHHFFHCYEALMRPVVFDAG
ncbi:hypothetical protein BDV93DRAFT_528816 [Ceratobasidium sp. AG-I]|nr:hypothetical protein BDV93DRAFT_528816 [Ceratobasidium sp. AG-I]